MYGAVCDVIFKLSQIYYYPLESHATCNRKQSNKRTFTMILVNFDWLLKENIIRKNVSTYYWKTPKIPRNTSLFYTL